MKQVLENTIKVKNFRRLLFIALILVFFGFATPIKADPPARIGRINYLNGAVSFQRSELDEWGNAALNYPMTTGDHIWVDNNSRAELHVGSTAIRLNDDTEFSFVNLDDDVVQGRLSQGSVNIHIRNIDDDEFFEIDTPNVAISLLDPGEYRIDVDNEGNTKVTTWHGLAEVTSSGYSFRVNPGKEAVINGIDDLSYDIYSAHRSDSFDTWSSDRKRREQESLSVQYISREMVGYEDLDRYGRWQNISGYGNVWAPTSIASGWTPYQEGSWAWIEPWGWTWIDNQPWGFAPSHYGRWANVQNVWYWVPGEGAVNIRPVYAPALVAFIGGNNWSLSIGSREQNVGWFPLAPNEVYVPAYYTSQNYRHNVNMTNVNMTNVNVTNVNITNVNYINRNVQGAVVAVPQQAFQNGRPVRDNAVKVNRQSLDSAQVVGNADVTPTQQSLLTQRNPRENRSINVAKPSTAIQNRPVVTNLAPPPPPVPFNTRQRALETNRGKPLDEATVNNMRQNSPVTQNGAKPRFKPAALPTTTSNGASTQALHPVREGLPPAQPAKTQDVRQPIRRDTPLNTPGQSGKTNPTRPIQPVPPRPPVPTRPSQPAQPIKPEPTRPRQPVRPEPSKPEQPIKPEPIKPGQPVRPEPTRPGQPVKPSPIQPIQPAQTIQPAQPPQIVSPKPGTNIEGRPNEGSPNRPNRPNPTQPRSNNEAKPDSETKPDQSERPNRPSPPTQPKPNDETKPNKEANPNHHDRSEPPNRPERPEQPKAKPNDEAKPDSEAKPNRPNRHEQLEPAQPKPRPNDETKPDSEDRPPQEDLRIVN